MTFADRVFETLSDGLAIDAAGNSSDYSPGIYFAIGETERGELFGFEENHYGQHVMYQFTSEDAMRLWFDNGTADLPNEDW